MKKLLGALVALAVVAVTVPALAGPKTSPGDGQRLAPMKYFVDTHDRANKTFPAQINKEGFAKFAAAFDEACRAEGVVILRVATNLETGRAYCFTAAPSAEAVRRAHERVGLPYDTITEVTTVTPGDMFP
jgi:hypothetical protein